MVTIANSLFPLLTWIRLKSIEVKLQCSVVVTFIITVHACTLVNACILDIEKNTRSALISRCLGGWSQRLGVRSGSVCVSVVSTCTEREVSQNHKN